MLRKPILALLLLALVAVAGPAAAQTCTASSSWVNNPTLPESLDESNHCNFAIFSWQSFLALMQPANTGNPGQLVFESYMSWDGLFVASGSPNPWGDTPWPLTVGGLTKQAGSNNNLIAQSGVEVMFDMAVNQPMYNYIANNQLYTQNCFNNGGMNIHMPPTTNPSTGAGSIELKTAWLPMANCDPTKYHCAPGLIDGVLPTQMGLIGIHIVHKIDDHQEWIWSSFEHVNNAPDCTKVTSPPSGYSSWNFFNSSFVPVGSSCDACTDSTGKSCNPANQCNTYVSQIAKPNVCRTTPLLSLTCQNNGNLNDDSNDVVCLNPSVWGLLPANSVWKNYMLVGTIWFKPGMTQPTTASSPFPPTGQSVVGNTTLANSVMETYTQGNNCFSCHKTAFATANASTPGQGGHADFSHLFNRIQQVGPAVAQCPALPTTQASHGTKADTKAEAPAPVKLKASHGGYKK
ncbi:MAG TPA: hypothetical protein VFR31_15595 [Thermoanaerobaculia bacterium]|nr:hypothetical protein [Thermoanaerobaculia bacterium]